MGSLIFGDEVMMRTFGDEFGCLTVVEPDVEIDFEIRRIYYLHSLRAEARRGGHAHKGLSQLIIPISGSFELTLTHKNETKRIEAKNPEVGYWIPPMTWRDITGFTSGAVCLVLASDRFDEEDYIRDWAEFTRLMQD